MCAFLAEVHIFHYKSVESIDNFDIQMCIDGNRIDLSLSV